jgi:hypothetical protein
LLEHLKHVGQLAQSSKDGKSNRSHLEALAARGDKLALKALQGPEVPWAVEYLLEWWYELGAGRAGGAWGPSAMTWQDVGAWARVTNTPVTAMEAAMLLRMDRVFLAAASPPETRKANG